MITTKILILLINLKILKAQNGNLTLADFISENFQHDFALLLPEFNEKLNFILEFNQTKTIVDSSKKLRFSAFQYYILVQKNYTLLKQTVSLYKFINTRARFLIILEDATTESELQEFFALSWSYYVYNIVAFVNWTDFVTWYPYSAQNQCGSAYNLSPLTKSVKPYDNKIPKTLSGCRVSVVWDQVLLSLKNPHNKTDPGYEVRVLDCIMENLKLEVNYIKFPYAILSFESFIRVSEFMKNNSIEMIFSWLPNDLFLNPDFELSMAYEDIYLFFIFPPRRKVIGSAQILVIFSSRIWILIVFSIISMTFLLTEMMGGSYQTNFFHILSLFLQCIIKTVPNDTLRRIIFFFFFFYVTNLNWIYTSQLSGVLSQPSYEPKLTKIQDLIDYDKKLHIMDGYNFILSLSSRFEQIQKIRTEWTGPLAPLDEMSNFARKLDHGIITGTARFSLFKNHEKLQSLYYEALTSTHSYFVVKRGLPFLHLINRNILYIKESGLLFKWLSESQSYTGTITVPGLDETPGHLDLNRFLGALVVLGVGLLISFLAFLMELAYFQYKH